MADNALRHVRVSAIREEPSVQFVSYPTGAKQFGAVGHGALWPALLNEAWHSEIPVHNFALIYGNGCSERKRSSTEITRHFWERPVCESGIHSTSSEGVDLGLVWLALLSEAWCSGVPKPNCSMIHGDGFSERQRSHMASKSFHEDLDRDTDLEEFSRT